ncbi:MAG: hypothetical protein EP298_11055 [Gammaproteobacteria bacterium]|nr:MAG: hypothetical protein EP298_11055 [Gammaproteobacteria bacterium]UTW43515.1 hypothetical protein KFE69_05335 [bacterium SCSIO 12844]
MSSDNLKSILSNIQQTSKNIQHITIIYNNLENINKFSIEDQNNIEKNLLKFNTKISDINHLIQTFKNFKHKQHQLENKFLSEMANIYYNAKSNIVNSNKASDKKINAFNLLLGDICELNQSNQLIFKDKRPSIETIIDNIYAVCMMKQNKPIYPNFFNELVKKLIENKEVGLQIKSYNFSKLEPIIYKENSKSTITQEIIQDKKSQLANIYDEFVENISSIILNSTDQLLPPTPFCSTFLNNQPQEQKNSIEL